MYKLMMVGGWIAWPFLMEAAIQSSSHAWRLKGVSLYDPATYETGTIVAIVGWLLCLAVIASWRLPAKV